MRSTTVWLGLFLGIGSQLGSQAETFNSGPLAIDFDSAGSLVQMTWAGRRLGTNDPTCALEARLGSETVSLARPRSVWKAANQLRLEFGPVTQAHLNLTVEYQCYRRRHGVVFASTVTTRGAGPLGSNLTLRLPLAPLDLPPDTWLPLKSGRGGNLGETSQAEYRFAGWTQTHGASLAVPLVSFSCPKAPTRITVFTDPFYSTRFGREALEWTYPAAVGLEQGREKRSAFTVFHSGAPDAALEAFYAEALPEIDPGPPWLHDIALIDYDYLSDRGKGWFRDVDALSAALPAKDRRQVFLCLHGWYDMLGRYCFDAKTRKFDLTWTAFGNAPRVQGHRAMTNAEGVALEVGFTNHFPVPMSLADVRRRLDYAKTRGFRVGLYYADGMNACEGMPDFDPGRVLYWGGWEGPDTRGKTFCQNPLTPAVRAFYLDYVEALLLQFGSSLDALVWDETFHVPVGHPGSTNYPGYADRGFMRLVRDVTLRVQAYNRQHHRQIAFLTSDCIGPTQSDRVAPYALLAHGTYQDSHCRPEYWSYGIFPNYRNVQWSCNWWPVSTWSHVEFGARHYQTPAVISNGWGDDHGFAELGPDQRRAVLDLFQWRKRSPTRLHWFKELPAVR